MDSHTLQPQNDCRDATLASLPRLAECKFENNYRRIMGSAIFLTGLLEIGVMRFGFFDRK